MTFPLDRNIIITGFMGTGKTTIGQLLAAELGRDIVDMDTQIEAHFGRTIAEVFASDGEAVFRAAESAICRQLAGETGLVISTGGGSIPSSSESTFPGEQGSASANRIRAREFTASMKQIQ